LTVDTGAIRRLIYASLVLIGVAACTDARPLPVAPNANRCRGVAIEAHLTGSVADDRVTWLVTEGDREIPVVWPAGWLVQFTPQLQVMDPDGEIRFRDGDAVTGICFKGPSGTPSSLVMIEGLGQ
jgi:hypothetical protein